MSTLPVNLIDQTTLSYAQQQIKANSEAMVKLLNDNMRESYYERWADFVTNMGSGQYIPPERRVAPKPPMAWELAPADSYGMVYYQIGTNPIVPQPVDPPYNGGNASPNTQPGVILMGPVKSDTPYRSALPGDTWPNGKETPPQSDGYIYVKMGGAILGWYLPVRRG